MRKRQVLSKVLQKFAESGIIFLQLDDLILYE